VLVTAPGSFAASRFIPEIRVQQSVPISVDELAARHVESWLAVNPRDPQNLIAASMVLGQRIGIAIYATFDGGNSWVRASRPSESLSANIDPAIAFDADGNAFLVTSDVAVWKSIDGGRNWGPAIKVPGHGYDRPFIGCDLSKGRFHGRIYVAAKMPITVFGHPGTSVLAATSSDGRGFSFHYPHLILPDPQRELLNVPAGLIVTPEGKLVIVLQTFSLKNIGKVLAEGIYSIIVSEDGGQSFSEPVKAAKFHVFGHREEGKSIFANGGGRIAMDRSSGPRHGWMYLTWLDAVRGYYHVMASVSSDGGKTWSRPVRVDGNVSATDTTNPAIAVNEEGTVGISWNDRRNDRTDRCYQVFFAASVDGGKSFSKNQIISIDFTCPIGTPPEPGKPLAPDPNLDPIRSEYRFKNGGDTQGIVGLPDGEFHLAWINGSSGELQLWSTVVSVLKPK
jgi:hypothetical protein